MLKQNIFTSLDALVGRPADKTPLAIAFSGGGDSTALLSITSKWLAGRRPLHAFIVDHGLRVDSDKEALLAAQTAKSLDAIPHILTWQGAKPKTGIQEKARMARYGLMGPKCRSLGIETLLLGHNQNDQVETLYMRGQKNSGWRGMAGMRARVVAPIWPELYGLTIVRPMLGVSRAALRAYNKENALPYIDDPSNENCDFTRIKARRFLESHPLLAAELGVIAQDAGQGLAQERTQIRVLLKSFVKIHSWGGATLSKQALAENGELSGELLRLLSLAVSGQGQATAREKYAKLCSAILGARFQGATLGGAQFIPAGPDIHIVRDPGQILGRSGRGELGAEPLSAGDPMIWDGRFCISTANKDISVAPLAAYTSQLTKPQKQALESLPLSARATLPALVYAGALVTSPVHGPSSQYSFENLTGERLSALSD